MKNNPKKLLYSALVFYSLSCIQSYGMKEVSLTSLQTFKTDLFERLGTIKILEEYSEKIREAIISKLEKSSNPVATLIEIDQMERRIDDEVDLGALSSIKAASLEHSLKIFIQRIHDFDTSTQKAYEDPERSECMSLVRVRLVKTFKESSFPPIATMAMVLQTFRDVK